MSLVIAETVAEQPITEEVLQEIAERAGPCHQARNITWQCSLLSTKRDRMICIYDAPDAESLRESYRRAGLLSRVVWAANLVQRETAQPQPDLMSRYVIEGTYPPLTEANWNEISDKLLHYCTNSGIEWLQSYLSFDRTKVIHELNIPDAKLMEEVPHTLEIPGDRSWSAQILRGHYVTRYC